MRPGGTLFALVSSLMLLLLLRLLWCPEDVPARSRLSVEESREDTSGTSAALRTLWNLTTPVPRSRNSTYLDEKTPQMTEKCKDLQYSLNLLSNKTRRVRGKHLIPVANPRGKKFQLQRSSVVDYTPPVRNASFYRSPCRIFIAFTYSEDDYLQIITNIQRCPWKRQAEEYDNFRAKLASCCDAVQDFVVSQNNTPVGTNMSYEVESKKQIHIRENIFHMFPVSQPFVDYPYNQCAVVGNGGILNKSLCGAEIDKSDFVFRCNLPPITGSASKDVGSKTNLVTVNPSIITLKYLRHLALFWRTKGVTAFRLSTGLMIASIAVELCENVKLYGFWPFSKTVEETPLSHHYYDNKLPKHGFHQMPKEYSQMLQLHMRGILKLQFSKCETA
uniref:alpha-2,8-sialyltransferase 8F isoform X3 n=1 Tax=Arvicanthis niloticus TaxID=61156 RepID=UPI001486C273|nr:alpha-2,8-sialyltransferase 8F isoform X3 [Arvicanthis niloticus]